MRWKGDMQKLRPLSASTSLLWFLLVSFCRQVLPIQLETCLPATQFHILPNEKDSFSLHVDMLTGKKNHSSWPYKGHMATPRLFGKGLYDLWTRDPQEVERQGRMDLSEHTTRRKMQIFWEHSPLGSLNVWKPLYYINVFAKWNVIH